MQLSIIVKKYLSSLILGVILIFSFFTMSLNTGTMEFSPRQAGMSFFSFFQVGVSRISGFVGGTVNSISELKKLKNDYDVLLKKVEDFQILQRDVVELRLENKRLKKQLEYSSSINGKYISSEIVAQEPGNLFTTMIIDKGSKEGITVNMPVIAFLDGLQGLVGKIVEVTPYSSKVLPVFNKSSFVGARLLASRYEGLVNGEGLKYGYLTMSYVKKGTKEIVKYGDIVTTSGMKSIYPKGIYIGRVREIDTPKWQPSLELKLEPVIDFSRLEYVFILVGGIGE